MITHIPHFIDGDRIPAVGDKKYSVYNPAKGEITAYVSPATETQIESAIAAAKKAFLTWSHYPALKRARILFQFKTLLENNLDNIAQLLTAEHGKTIEDAKGEVGRAIELVEFSCGTPHLLQGSYSENVANGVDTHTVKQALGVCVGISPFNFPVMISMWMAIPAIACGNTFILKPSEKDPSTTVLLAQLLQEAGLPKGVFSVLQGDKETVQQLITHPDVTAVSAVGSTPVAEYIYRTAISHGKRVHTFGGAKNHCVVMPDADIDEVSNAVLGAAFGAAGERCMAISVVVAVTDFVANKLVEKLQNAMRTLVVAPGSENTVDMGPLITAEHLSRVKDHVASGVADGATLIVDGRALTIADHEQGFFMGPCLFDRVTPSMRIYREEIFGPVLCIVRQHSLEEAITLINQNEYGNGVSIFTNDGGVAREFASGVTVGMVGVNVPIPVPVTYHTFGGWKRSFFGDIALHAEDNVRFYTRAKTITTRWPNRASEAAFHMISH